MPGNISAQIKFMRSILHNKRTLLNMGKANVCKHKATWYRRYRQMKKQRKATMKFHRGIKEMLPKQEGWLV